MLLSLLILFAVVLFAVVFAVVVAVVVVLVVGIGLAVVDNNEDEDEECESMKLGVVIFIDALLSSGSVLEILISLFRSFTVAELLLLLLMI